MGGKWFPAPSIWASRALSGRSCCAVREHAESWLMEAFRIVELLRQRDHLNHHIEHQENNHRRLDTSASAPQASSPPPQLTTFPTFHCLLLSSEGMLSSRASRLSRRQRCHRLSFLSSGGGGGPITALTDDAEIGAEDDTDGTLTF